MQKTQSKRQLKLKNKGLHPLFKFLFFDNTSLYIQFNKYLIMFGKKSYAFLWWFRKSPKQEEAEYVEPQQPTYEDDYSYIEEELEDLTLDDINEILGETPTEEDS